MAIPEQNINSPVKSSNLTVEVTESSKLDHVHSNKTLLKEHQLETPITMNKKEDIHSTSDILKEFRGSSFFNLFFINFSRYNFNIEKENK